MTRAEAVAFPVFKSAEGEAAFRVAYDLVLKSWPVPFEEADVTTRLGATHVIASGPRDAPPLVLLHSMAGTATLWRPNVAALSKRHRVYAVDVPGQAGKSVLSRRIESREDFAGWFADVLAGLGHKRASIVGSSYGGFLALNQAMLTPEIVDRIVMISPPGTFAPVSGKFIFAMMVKGPLMRLMGHKRSHDITRLLGPGQTLAPEDAAWGELMTVTMRESARPGLVPPIVFSDAQLQSVKAPALLLIGEHERLYDAQDVLRRAQARMPGLSGAVIPGAHHLAALARPEDVNARILAFLDGEAPRT